MADTNNIKAFMGNLIKEAERNPAYRQKLINNPKEVIEEKLKFKLPDEFKVVVHQDTPRRLNIVLPNESKELSEMELAAVSGGVCWSYDSCPDHFECVYDSPYPY
jgi:hypothetical protein